MPSITCWTRLEPRTVRTDMADSLAARVHDPLWQLARQWQIGEFTAEDTGSPVSARVRIEQALLTRVWPGPLATGATGRPYDPRMTPLEPAVEGEPAVPHARLAVVAGLQFLEQLARRGVAAHGAAYAARYPLPPAADGPLLDEAARRFLSVVGGRTIDGVRLSTDLRAAETGSGGAGGALPPQPEIPAADRAAVIDAAQAFVDWYDTETGRGLDAAAWQRDRFEYAFAVAGPTPTAEQVLVAPEYTAGRLDWSTFDHQPGATLGAAADRARARTVTRTIIPTPVTYRGMPASRWWEFEDAEVDFGQIEAGPTDLMRLLLVSFAVEYGNDWFILPVELDVGAVYRVRSVVVTDSFGQRILVRPAAQVDAARRDWRMFSPAPRGDTLSGGIDASAELMVLAPVAATTIEAEPIEEVALARDELANVAWAIERVVESAAGGRLDRVAAARRGAAAAGNGEGELQYRLSTTVPENWLPVVPVRVEPTKPDVRLRRGRVLLDRGGQPATPPALGRLLDPGTPLDVHEEEVPRAGRRLTRAPRYTRWIDGSTHVWIGRRSSAGRGEAWSGLRFDLLERPVDSS